MKNVTQTNFDIFPIKRHRAHPAAAAASFYWVHIALLWISAYCDGHDVMSKNFAVSCTRRFCVIYVKRKYWLIPYTKCTLKAAFLCTLSILEQEIACAYISISNNQNDREGVRVG